MNHTGGRQPTGEVTMICWVPASEPVSGNHILLKKMGHR